MAISTYVNLSKEERKYFVRKMMLGILHYEILDNQFTNLSRLYELSHIDNSDLIKEANVARWNPFSPTEKVFSDMALTLYKKSEQQDSILQHFIEFMKEQHSEKFLLTDNFLRIWNEKGHFKALKYAENNRLLTITKNGMEGSIDHIFLFTLLVLENVEIDTCFLKLYKEKCDQIEEQFQNPVDKNFDNENLYRFNSGECIFEGMIFERYLKKRERELVEYLEEEYSEEIVDGTLYKFLSDKLKSNSREEVTPATEYVESIVSQTTKHILAEKCGGAEWHNAITNDGKEGYLNPQFYKPDLEYIVRLYYKEYVKQQYRSYFYNNGMIGFTKVYLSRSCSPSPREAFLGIAYLYNIDVVCELLNNIRDEYYSNFSWEKILGKSVTERYNNYVSDLEKINNELKTRLKVEMAKQNAMEVALRKEYQVDENAIEFERTLSKLAKDIEEKDKEIFALRKQLENKEEYIRHLLSQEDAEVKHEIDLSVLQTKRYLFVGFANEAMPELRRKFPNSIFMDSEGMSLHDIKVDGIVLLIKYMSHGMYYKVCSAAISREVPTIYCNTKNINTIYNKMLEIK